MFRFIETIRIEDGVPQNLSLHQQRMELTFELFFAVNEVPSLKKHLNRKVFPEKGIYKCRILYNKKILKTEFENYIPKEIFSFRLVTDNQISYEFKFSDRRKLIREKSAGEELIFVKNGLITDTAFSNIAVMIAGSWYTPAQPLLKGTMRNMLLQSGKIRERNISAGEFLKCEKFRLINAMLPLETSEDYFPGSILC